METIERGRVCAEFAPLTNGGDFRGSYCCTCGEKESAHVKPLVWADLWAAMDANPTRWIPTTSEMYWEMLECLPPRMMGKGGFLVGEANNHNADGESVHACFVQHGDSFEARYMTCAEFKQWLSVR